MHSFSESFLLTEKVFLNVFALLGLISDSSCIVLFFKSENGDKAISHLSLFHCLRVSELQQRAKYPSSSPMSIVRPSCQVPLETGCRALCE